jgi:signal peptidase I
MLIPIEKHMINKRSNKKIILFLQKNKQFILFIFLMCIFRSAVADWYTVPTGSMQPTIQEGDRIVVNKMAYDLRLPFTGVTLVSLDIPQRGEIIIFESKAANMRLIKRVIGLPGDVVTMNNEVIQVNGKTFSYKPSVKTPSLQNTSITTSIETIGSIQHHVNIDNTASNKYSSFAPVTVPSGHYLVLGDNRRHSADSRFYGFVPHHELRGKATAIAFSLNYDNYYIPRTDRFLQDIYGI